jgi:LPXTG-site transpeptidase (sortase) family protein
MERARHRIRRFLLRWLERLFVLAAIACAAWVYTTWRDAIEYQIYAKNELDHVIGRDMPVDVSNVATDVREDTSVIGLLSIPRVNLSVAVVEGDDAHALRLAVGHLPDTPLPWQEGNAAFAGHRDGFFNPLQSVHRGDEITLATRRGTLRYRVSLTEIVEPNDLSVLGPLGGADLTLITCYPFGYFGPAPQRFIVQAVKLASSSDTR